MESMQMNGKSGPAWTSQCVFLVLGKFFDLIVSKLEIKLIWKLWKFHSLPQNRMEKVLAIQSPHIPSIIYSYTRIQCECVMGAVITLHHHL